MFTAVTEVPDWVTVAFYALVTFWSPGNFQPTVHAVHGAEPVFATVTFAVKPPPYSLALA